MPVYYAKSKNSENKVYLIVDAVGAPQTEKSKESCATYDSYLDGGALCYRVCGELPKGKRPAAYRYFSRRSHQGDDAGWVECSGDGCEGFDPYFDEHTSTVCSSFKLWKGHGEHRDLMIEVSVA